MKSIFEYEHPFVTTDAVVFTIRTKEPDSYHRRSRLHDQNKGAGQLPQAPRDGAASASLSTQRKALCGEVVSARRFPEHR